MDIDRTNDMDNVEFVFSDVNCSLGLKLMILNTSTLRMISPQFYLILNFLLFTVVFMRPMLTLLMCGL